MNIFFRSVILTGVSFGAALASPAMASSQVSANLDVSATVSSSCAVSTTPLAFATVDVTSGSAVDGTGSIVVTCTNGAAWSASAGVGTGTGASLASRKMANGANLLSYALYTDSGRSLIWGNGTASTSTIDATGTGSAQTRTIYGRVPSGQSAVLAGSYADTVAVTVTYL